MTERDPEGHDDDEARLTFEGLPLVDGGRRAVARKPGATGGRLVPRPEKGLAFADALDESMRDHFAVYAALAK